MGFVLTRWEIVIFAGINFVSMRYGKHTYVFVGEKFRVGHAASPQ